MRTHYILVAALVVASSISNARQTAHSQTPSPPLSVSDIEHGLKAGVTNARMADLVKQYGVDFELTDSVTKQLRTAGANEELLSKIPGSRHSSATPSAPAQEQPQPSGTSIVLIDTDETCHLILDDQDEGTITPAQSRKVTMVPGEHIVKCAVDNIPDLAWRKIIQVSAGSQSVVAIALKDLHEHKIQAAAQEENARAANIAAAEEAQNRAQQQEEFTAKLAVMVDGTWTGTVTVPGWAPVAIQATFSKLGTGEVKLSLQTTAKLPSCNPCSAVWEVELKGSSGSVLVNDGAQRCVSYMTKGKYNTKGWQPCTQGSANNDIAVAVVGGNQLQVKWPHDPHIAMWGLWEGDTFALSRSGK